MQLDKQIAHSMHQKAVEQHMHMDRVSRMEKENMVAMTHSYMTRLSPSRRMQSPVREYIIQRRSVSPIKSRDSPLKQSFPPGMNVHASYQSILDKRPSYVGLG